MDKFSTASYKFTIATKMSFLENAAYMKHIYNLPIDQKHSPSVHALSNRPSSSKGTWTNP